MANKEVPQPCNIRMLKTSLKYPFLKKDLVCTIPLEKAKELLQNEEAETALNELDTPTAIYGDNSFSKQDKQITKKKNDEEKVPKLSLLIDENYMYEQIKKKDGTFAFLKYSFETGSIEEVNTIGEIHPIDDEEAVRDFIKLPSGVEEYGTEKELIAKMTTHIKKYLDVPDDYVKITCLNIMKSWVFQRYHSINYLRVRGEPGTGKSRFLDTVGHLHYKVIATSGATTVAPVFRLIDKWGGTLSIDEADLNQGDETNDMIKIINQGFEKDKPVMRCNAEDVSVIDFFDVYCPKVLSTRRNFKDLATESRCMTHIMTGTSRQDIPSSLNDEYANETAKLRNMLLLWRFRKYKQINPDIGETLNWKGIEARLKQVNVGFVSLFYDDKEYTEQFLSQVRLMQQDLKQERTTTPEGMIIQGIMNILLLCEQITAQNIINHGKLTDDRGNAWKPQKLAPYMKTLGFSPAKKVRFGDEILKIYLPLGDHLHSLFTKFMPEDELKDSYKELLKVINQYGLGKTYSDLFVSLCPCVTCLVIGPEQVTK